MDKETSSFSGRITFGICDFESESRKISQLSQRSRLGQSSARQGTCENTSPRLPQRPEKNQHIIIWAPGSTQLPVLWSCGAACSDARQSTLAPLDSSKRVQPVTANVWPRRSVLGSRHPYFSCTRIASQQPPLLSCSVSPSVSPVTARPLTPPNQAQRLPASQVVGFRVPELSRSQVQYEEYPGEIHCAADELEGLELVFAMRWRRPFARRCGFAPLDLAKPWSLPDSASQPLCCTGDGVSTSP